MCAGLLAAVVGRRAGDGARCRSVFVGFCGSGETTPILRGLLGGEASAVLSAFNGSSIWNGGPPEGMFLQAARVVVVVDCGSRWDTGRKGGGRRYICATCAQEK